MVASENPFSVHRIRPGAIPYLFSHEDSATDLAQLDRLIDRWKSNGYVGQIVGPHGCGKTTLAHWIAKRSIESSRYDFETAYSMTVRKKSVSRFRATPSSFDWIKHFGANRFEFKTSMIAGDRTANSSVPNLARSTGAMLIIDGIEQLNMMERVLMIHSLRRCGIPTLLTVHRLPTAFPFVTSKWPVLIRVAPNLKVFTKLVSLLTGTSDSITQLEIDASFKSFDGNCREAFMSLYDASGREKFI